jgi:osmoprotectant transport system ATP-binding protein
MKNPADEFVAKFIGRNRIWSSPEFIRAQDIMIQDPVCAPPDMTILRCIEKMRLQKVDSLLITDRQGHVLGIVTAKKAQIQLNKQTPVAEMMRREFEKVLPEQNIIEVLKVVNQSKLRTIPVIDEKNLLRGLITKSSLLTTLSQQYLDTGGDDDAD